MPYNFEKKPDRPARVRANLCGCDMSWLYEGKRGSNPRKKYPKPRKPKKRKRKKKLTLHTPKRRVTS